MARFITPPQQGEDVRKLYLKVAECVECLNAIMNMTVSVEGRLRMIGRLNVTGGSSVLKLEESTEVGSFGT